MSSVQVSLVREFRTLNEKLDKLFSRSSATKLTDYKIEIITESSGSDDFTISYMCSAIYCGVYKFTGPLQLKTGQSSWDSITSSVIAPDVRLINGKLVYKDMTEFYISRVEAIQNSSTKALVYFSCDASIVDNSVPQFVVPIGALVSSSNKDNYTWECYEYDTATDTITENPTASTPSGDLLAAYIMPSNPPRNKGVHFYVSELPANLREPSSAITCYRFATNP